MSIEENVQPACHLFGHLDYIKNTFYHIFFKDLFDDCPKYSPTLNWSLTQTTLSTYIQLSEYDIIY